MPQVNSSFPKELISRIDKYDNKSGDSFSRKIMKLTDKGLDREKELVSFGNYLLSPQRLKRIKDTWGKDWKHKVGDVNEADLRNWENL